MENRILSLSGHEEAAVPTEVQEDAKPNPFIDRQELSALESTKQR